MYFRDFVVHLIVLLVVVPASIVSQDKQPLRLDNGRLPTLAENLKRHNIATTPQALKEALRNPNAEIRYLAALKLAEDGAKDAIPSLQSTLGAEKDHQAHLNISLALAQLGDSKGFDALQATCNDNHEDAGRRMIAARYMLDLDRQGCSSAVIDQLRSGVDAESRIQAMDLLPRFQNISQDDQQKILNLLVVNLSDSTPAVRIAASEALGSQGGVAAVPYLQAAVAREKDDTVRSAMQSDLQTLQDRTKQQ
jgi:HEAT repeat protein